MTCAYVKMDVAWWCWASQGWGCGSEVGLLGMVLNFSENALSTMCAKAVDLALHGVDVLGLGS